MRSRSASDRRLPLGRNLDPVRLLPAAAAPRLDTLTGGTLPSCEDPTWEGLASEVFGKPVEGAVELSPASSPWAACRLPPRPPLGGILTTIHGDRQNPHRSKKAIEGRYLDYVLGWGLAGLVNAFRI